MRNKVFSWDLFYKIPLIGIMRNIPPDKTELIAGIFADAGLTNLEITMNSPDAPATISRLVRIFGDRLNIGAGTVCSCEDLTIALSAGAQFIVTPIMQEEVISKCVAEKVPIFPGAYTPSEICKAWSLGASMVKVFPATQLGPGYIKEVLAPLDHIKLLVVGGVNIDNFPAFLAAGAKGWGMGSQLFPEKLVSNDHWHALHLLFSDLIHKFHNHAS